MESTDKKQGGSVKSFDKEKTEESSRHPVPPKVKPPQKPPPSPPPKKSGN